MSSSSRREWPAMSVEDFLAWDGGGHQGKLELVDGEVRAMSPASATHGLIQLTFGSLLRQHLKQSGSRCSVLAEPPVSVRIRSDMNLRVPDLGVTCSPIAATERLLPDPVLLIEVLSPGNQNDTWDNVWAYCTIPTVQEIVVVHSTRIRAELLRRDASGTWPENPEVIEKGGALGLVSIGFTTPLTEVYADTYLA